MSRTAPLTALLLVLSVLPAAAAATDGAALVEAVKHRDVASATALLAKHANANAAEVDGTTALHWAVRSGDARLVEMLVRAGANANTANRYGVKPLSIACETGEAAIVEALLRAGADPNAPSTEGETPLMTAARTGRVRSVDLLIARGADINKKESWRGQTALMWAAAEGYPDVVQTLIKHGTDIATRSNGGFTALLFAVREGKIETARVLLDAGASPHESLVPPARRGPEGAEPAAAPETGLTALLVAIGSGHFELASFLLDRGADPNAAPQGWTALHQLTWVRKTGVAGSNNPPPQGSGNMDSLELARRLVAHGAELNVRVTKRPPAGVSGLNFIGGTPFLLAARTADAEYMRLLATLGADPRLPNKDNSTPLVVAAGLGTYAPGEDPGTEPEVLEAVKVALELGNDINAVDDHGQTVMHGAAYKHVPSVVEYLARAGANIEVWNHMNADGRTPLDITIGVPSSMSIIRSPITEDAIRRVMIAAGVTPPPHYNPKY
jgi:ankyrin repeat protein